MDEVEGGDSRERWCDRNGSDMKEKVFVV